MKLIRGLSDEFMICLLLARNMSMLYGCLLRLSWQLRKRCVCRGRLVLDIIFLVRCALGPRRILRSKGRAVGRWRFPLGLIGVFIRVMIL